MKKKYLSLSVLSVMVTILFASVVRAAPSGAIEGAMAKLVGMFKAIADGLFQVEVLGSETMLKFLLAILIFAILYGSSTFVLGRFAKNVRITISLIIALISVIFIPQSLLLSLAQLYGGVFVALLLAIPVIAGGWLLFGVFKEETKFHYMVKFAIAMILWFVTAQMGSLKLQNVSGSAAVSGAFGIFSGIETVCAIASPIFFILAIYYIIRAFSAERTPDTTTAGAALEQAAQQVEAARRGGQRLGAAFKGSGKGIVKKIMGSIEKMYKEMSKTNPPPDQAHVDPERQALAQNMLSLTHLPSDVDAEVLALKTQLTVVDKRIDSYFAGATPKKKSNAVTELDKAYNACKAIINKL